MKSVQPQPPPRTGITYTCKTPTCFSGSARCWQISVRERNLEDWRLDNYIQRLCTLTYILYELYLVFVTPIHVGVLLQTWHYSYMYVFSYCISFQHPSSENSQELLDIPLPPQEILWIHPFHPSNKCQPNRPAARWNPWQLLLPPPGPSNLLGILECNLPKRAQKKTVELVNDNLISNYEVIYYRFWEVLRFFVETELQGEFMNVSF